MVDKLSDEWNILRSGWQRDGRHNVHDVRSWLLSGGGDQRKRPGGKRMPGSMRDWLGINGRLLGLHVQLRNMERDLEYVRWQQHRRRTWRRPSP